MIRTRTIALSGWICGGGVIKPPLAQDVDAAIGDATMLHPAPHAVKHDTGLEARPSIALRV